MTRDKQKPYIVFAAPHGNEELAVIHYEHETFAGALLGFRDAFDLVEAQYAARNPPLIVCLHNTDGYDEGCSTGLSSDERDVLESWDANCRVDAQRACAAGER